MKTTRNIIAPILVFSLSAFGNEGASPQAAPREFSTFNIQEWVCDSSKVVVRDSAKFPGKQELEQTGAYSPQIAYLKDFSFTDGTIECDLAGGAYLGVSFRVRPVEGKAATERVSEDIYFRVEGNQRSATVQYYPHGKLKQDELHQPPFEQPVPMFAQGEWFHVRIEVSGRQARVFVGDSKEPVQIIPELMHEHQDGSVGLRSWGGRFANLKITPRAAHASSPAEKR
jgi:hypothetical protein